MLLFGVVNNFGTDCAVCDESKTIFYKLVKIYKYTIHTSICVDVFNNLHFTIKALEKWHMSIWLEIYCFFYRKLCKSFHPKKKEESRFVFKYRKLFSRYGDYPWENLSTLESHSPPTTPSHLRKSYPNKATPCLNVSIPVHPFHD